MRWVWWVRRWPTDQDRYGQPCEVLVWGGMGNILVRFADGYTVVTSRHFVRRRKERTS